MAYPSAAALVAAASGDARAALDDLDAAQLDSLRTAAIAAIEEHCQQKFVSVEETRAIDAAGGTRLVLPQRLARLDELAVRGSTIAATDVVLAEDRSTLTLIPLSTGSAYMRLVAQVDPEVRHRQFAEGYGFVTIAGAWGWLDEEFPPEVAVALRIDMEDNALADANALSGSVQAYRAMGLRSIRQGNLAAEIHDTPNLSRRAQRPLRGLIWHAHGATA